MKPRPSIAAGRRYLTPDELMARWAISEDALKTMREKSRISFTKLTRRTIRYAVADVEKYEQQHRIIAL